MTHCDVTPTHDTFTRQLIPKEPQCDGQIGSAIGHHTNWRVGISLALSAHFIENVTASPASLDPGGTNMNVKQGPPISRRIELESVQVIDAPIKDLWSLVSDFDNVSQWHPDVIDSRIESGSSQQPGAVRSITLRNGMQIKERLNAISAAEWFYNYSILESPLPIRDHESTVRFTPLGNSKTEVRWIARFAVVGTDPSPLADGIKKGVLDLGIEGLRQAVAQSANEVTTRRRT
jgi:hypothetical protein